MFRQVLTLMAATTTVAAIAQSDASQLIINEICNSNIDQWVDPSFNYGCWAEFYNPTSKDISLYGHRLSGDPANLLKARVTQTTIVPAHGYKVVWFDSYHPRYSPKTIDMKLDEAGGTLYLSDADGNLLLSQTYPEAVGRCSWARTSDGGDTWQYCANPSPEASNVDRLFASKRLAAPEVDQMSMVFRDGSARLQVTIPEGCTLRYTTDGSAPTLTNGMVSQDGVFETNQTKLYRFRLFCDGYLPSEVVTRSCIRSTYDIDLPILSITSTYKNFYSDSIGIFVKGGINGRPGRGQQGKCNWNMDWERPAVFEYFTPEGEMLFNQEVGIERCGGWSRSWTPYSFKIKANKRYEGHKTLDYKFFDEKPYLKHKTLQIRNGGNDNNCRVIDPFLQRIVGTSGLNVDYQAYQPVAHFINGVWKGTINMREPNNKHFVYANYGWDDEVLDQFEMSPDSGYVQNCGDNVAWKQLIECSKTASTPASYEQIRQLLDIDEFCNYMAVEFYLGNWDWPQNNIKAWRPRLDEGGRFRFVLMDLDGMDGTTTPFTTFAGKKTYTFDYLYDLNRRFTKEIEVVTLFLNLLSNDDFRRQFIDTYCLVTYSVFEPSRCQEIISQLANRVAHTQSLYQNSSPWNSANKLISTLGTSRQTRFLNQLRNYSKMKLSGQTARKASICTDLPEARLLFNGLPVPLNRFDGSYFAPLTVTASAPAGYVFEGWKQLDVSNTTLMAQDATWSYYDQGSLDGKDWTSTDFDDTAWSTGKAPLGYFTDGKRDYNTTLDYGTNKNNKRPTYYFRTRVKLNDQPDSNDVMVLKYKVDDGAVVYVNGCEAARYNMPAGDVTYSTLASSYTEGNPDEGSLTLPASLFVQGDNLIAVELHNNANNSTDVYWNASLMLTSYNGGNTVSTELSYTLPDDPSAASLIACFAPADNAEALPPVVVNELSAGNDVYVNEYQKRNDWVELYNTTDQDIDLEGMYLSDNLSKPQKYRITAEGTEASTIIPAHGYKIIWCDKLETLTQLHASFKLSNDPGDQQHVMLTSADGSWSDTLSYYQHAGTESVGRYPDGSRQVYLMTRPSIDRTNELTSYNSLVSQPSDNAIEHVTIDSSDDTYRVFDLSGRLVATGHGTYAQPELPAGIYIVRSGNRVFRVMER